MLTRRSILIAASATLLPATRAFAKPNALHDIEATLGPGARLGVMAKDATTITLSHRAHERFAMCSTVKLPLVAAVLTEIDADRLHLDTPVEVAPKDIVDGPHRILAGPTTIERLCAAAMIASDNTAANVLLRRIGGPAALTRFMRRHDGGPTRLDRNEPTLNTNLPHDPRDTTTPADMVALMHALLIGNALSPASRDRLTGWMIACTTGRGRLRGGLPDGWRAGDRTGTGERGAANDIAIVWPPRRSAPLLIASYVDAPNATPAARDAAHAAVGRLAAMRIQAVG